MRLTSDKPSASPLEAWITKNRLVITARLVYSDESTQDIDVTSLSLRGVQRELTGQLIAEGYQPAERWQDEDDDGDEYVECSRKFRRAEGAGAE